MLLQLQALVARSLEHAARPFYLIVDNLLRAQESAGNGARYGFYDLAAGSALSEQLLFLLGTEGAVDPYRTLECVTTAAGTTANIHIVALEGGWGLAYFDASREHDRRQQQQQIANELSLLQHRQQRLLAELQSTQIELEAANRVKSLFIAGMSHEFRTPISSILGYTELLTESLAEDTAALKQLGAVSRGANHLLSLVENLLDQARIEQHEMVLYAGMSNFRLLSAQLDEMFRPLAEQKQLELSWQVHSDVPESLWIDELRVRQMLINLIGNALKFTRKGRISITAGWLDDILRVEVNDTGPGIPSDIAAHLFEPFRKGNENMKGAGLGLSISHALARLMAGQLELVPAVQPGTTMRLTLHAPTSAAPADTGSSYQSLRGLSLLVTDDDDEFLELARVFLSNAGAKVATARTGPETLRRARRDKPDLLLLDLHLKGERGEELAATCREQGFANPIILMSARNDTTTHAAARSTRCDAFVSKPLDREALYELIINLTLKKK